MVCWEGASCLIAFDTSPSFYILECLCLKQSCISVLIERENATVVKLNMNYDWYNARAYLK